MLRWHFICRELAWGNKVISGSASSGMGCIWTMNFGIQKNALVIKVYFKENQSDGNWKGKSLNDISLVRWREIRFSLWKYQFALRWIKISNDMSSSEFISLVQKSIGILFVIRCLIHSKMLCALTSFASFIFTSIKLFILRREKTGTLEKWFASG